MNLHIDPANWKEIVFALEARMRASGPSTNSYKICKQLVEQIRRQVAAEHAPSNGKMAGVDSAKFKEY